MASVGDRIRERRIELGWTQDQLAQKACISKSFLSDLENNKRSVSASNLLDISVELGLSLDYLMTGRGTKSTTSEDEDVRVPAALSRLASEAGLSFRQTLTLLDMQRQIVAHRSATRKDDLESVDWRKFYESVKEFL
jgi:transcriptional regulator with XRE-family HTH domain